MSYYMVPVRKPRATPQVSQSGLGAIDWGNMWNLLLLSGAIYVMFWWIGADDKKQRAKASKSTSAPPQKETWRQPGMDYYAIKYRGGTIKEIDGPTYKHAIQSTYDFWGPPEKGTHYRMVHQRDMDRTIEEDEAKKARLSKKYDVRWGARQEERKRKKAAARAAKAARSR